MLWPRRLAGLSLPARSSVRLGGAEIRLQLACAPAAHSFGMHMYPVLAGLSIVFIFFGWLWRHSIGPLHVRLSRGMEVLESVDSRLTTVEKALRIISEEKKF